MEDRPHKAHRPEKKEKKTHSKGFNEKAFTSTSFRNAERAARRTLDLDQKKLHVPLINRTPDENPPPIVIAIVGPPGVGKTTLLKSLVRRYTKHTLSAPLGPITVVSGKKRRLTFIECPNDLGSMIDVGKIADLVLLMIDGSFGFEMDTFEFINILQTHGFPKIIGILTHLDLIRSAPTLALTKKSLKKRFWTEIYQGAKLFYLSGVINGRYPDTEVLNLTRFVGVMKFRPLEWRNKHAYVLCDRIEDITPRQAVKEDPKMDRKVAVFGYVRGVPLKASSTVTMPGVGDFTLHGDADGEGIGGIKALQDPCPLPTVESEKRRKLADKQRVVWAPMSDVGGVVFDRDGVYVNVPGNFTRAEGEDESGIERGEGERMVLQLQDMKEDLAERVGKSNIQLFKDSARPLQVQPAEDDDSESGSEEDDGEGEEDFSDDDDDVLEEGEGDGGDRGRTSLRRPTRGTDPSSSATLGTASNEGGVEFAESDDDLGLEEDDDDDGEVELEGDEEDEEAGEDEDGDDDDNNEVPRWKTRLDSNVESLVSSRRRIDWNKLVYNSELSPKAIIESGKQEDPITVEAAEDDEEDEEFFTLRRDTTVMDGDDDEERSKPVPASLSADGWDDEFLDSFRRFFITGDEPPAKEGEVDGEGNAWEDEEGGLELLEGDAENDAAAPSTGREEKELAKKKEILKRKFDQQYDDDDGADGDGPSNTPGKDYYQATKDAFAQQLALNRAELDGLDDATRLSISGYTPGTYVRIELSNIPHELLTHFSPSHPLVLGAVLPSLGEDKLALLHTRVKRHRWHPKILKTNDPLIISMGWRRFQTLPIYALDDHSIRMRMLKYTPEHMHCYATFFGPVHAPNTPFCAFNAFLPSSQTPGFRISATGIVLDVDKTTSIVKKLKLRGEPYKIFKNTAFIKGMFGSALEVAKFEGAKIRTVSGVRGEVKKALSGKGTGIEGGAKEGCFRATFEDRVLMSDVIFLRAWTSLQPRKYYNPVLTLLQEDKSQWTGMRLTGQIRRDQGLKTPQDVNSIYKPIDRAPRKFNTLKVPRALQAALPYSSKPKVLKPQQRKTYLQKRAVVLSPEEKKTVAVMQQIRALRRDQVQRRKETKAKKNEEYRKKKDREEEKSGEKDKEKRKEYMRVAGVKKKREEEKDSGRGGRPRKRAKH